MTIRTMIIAVCACPLALAVAIVALANAAGMASAGTRLKLAQNTPVNASSSNIKRPGKNAGKPRDTGSAAGLRSRMSANEASAAGAFKKTGKTKSNASMRGR